MEAYSLQILRAARICLAYQVVTLTPQGSRYLIQVKLGMVLHAPEHAGPCRISTA